MSQKKVPTIKQYIISGLTSQQKEAVLTGLRNLYSPMNIQAEQFRFADGRKNDRWEIYTDQPHTFRQGAEMTAFAQGVCFGLSFQPELKGRP
jgi:hypothetical protein